MLYIYTIYTCYINCVYIYNMCIYIYMSGGQNYLLPAMDVAKVGGPLLVVKVCAQF